MLSLAGVRKSYGAQKVVCGVDLELRAGECYGLLGPNGAGKTTTLRLALGLTDPDAGRISLLMEPSPEVQDDVYIVTNPASPRRLAVEKFLTFLPDA